MCRGKEKKPGHHETANKSNYLVENEPLFVTYRTGQRNLASITTKCMKNWEK